MSYTTTESDDAMQSSIHNESPAADTGNGCRSRWKGSALKKGPWTTGEDEILIDYVKKHGEGNWNAVQKHTSLSRCGKSCRLRWANHLRPNLKKGAFSQEEEQLIVEMHSKMGNKWARMAEHLPGRTDNEIKNYWNTRIKRRQRAGLPLYPPGMHVEVMQWSEEYTENKIIGTDRGPQDFLQLGNCKTNVLFDGLNFSTSGMLPSASELSDIVGCNILGTGATSSQYESFVQPTMLSPKLLGDFGSRFPGCSSNINIKHEYPSPEHFQNTALQRNPRSSNFSPCDVDPLYGNQHSSDMISDSHTVSDGMLPTSKPLFGAVKLELPSFQYPPDSTFDQWKTTPSSPHSDLLDSVDAYIQSPPLSTLQDPDCFSSCDTGLLDMLLQEAKIKTSAKHSSDHSFDTTQIKSEEYGDSLKNLVHSEIPSRDGISSGHVIKSEQLGQIYGQKRQQSWRGSTVPDITRPDVLLASSSSWLDQGFGIVRDSSSMSDALAVLLGDEIGNSYMNMNMSVGTSSSGQGQAFGVGVGSCAWTNMPQICQMMELP